MPDIVKAHSPLAECIAALMGGPRTIVDLCEMVDIGKSNAGRWMEALQESGVVRATTRPGKMLRGRQPVVYELQATLFGLPSDAEAE